MRRATSRSSHAAPTRARRPVTAPGPGSGAVPAWTFRSADARASRPPIRSAATRSQARSWSWSVQRKTRRAAGLKHCRARTANHTHPDRRSRRSTCAASWATAAASSRGASSASSRRDTRSRGRHGPATQATGPPSPPIHTGSARPPKTTEASARAASSAGNSPVRYLRAARISPRWRIRTGRASCAMKNPALMAATAAAAAHRRTPPGPVRFSQGRTSKRTRRAGRIPSALAAHATGGAKTGKTRASRRSWSASSGASTLQRRITASTIPAATSPCAATTAAASGTVTAGFAPCPPPRAPSSASTAPLRRPPRPPRRRGGGPPGRARAPGARG